MNKGILAAVVIVCLGVVGFFVYNTMQKSSENVEGVVMLAKGDFGFESIELSKKKNYTLACNDAKELVSLINLINQDFVNNPELDVEKDNMTPSMKTFESKMDLLGKGIEGQYAKDPATLELVYSGLGEGVSNVFQVTVMSHMGMLDPEKVNQFVDVAFCGVAAPEGYVSPIEMLNSMTPDADMGGMGGMGGGMGGHGGMMSMPADNQTPATK